MKLLKTILSNLLYLVLPLSFFALWYFGCAFTEWIFDPREMTNIMRFVIIWLGMGIAIIGFSIAYRINNKQKY